MTMRLCRKNAGLTIIAFVKSDGRLESKNLQFVTSDRNGAMWYERIGRWANEKVQVLKTEGVAFQGPISRTKVAFISLGNIAH